MGMKNRSLSLLVSLLFLPGLAASALAQTPDEIIEKHLTAMGGRDVLAKLTSRRATGTVTISTAAGNLVGPIEVDTKAPNKTRAYMELDLSALGVPDKMVLEQKFDGATAWTLNSMQGNTQITGDQLETMKNNAFPTPLLNYKATGTTIEALPKEQVNGKDAFVLRLTPKTGPSSRLYFDAETYLLVRSVATISSEQVGALEQTSNVSDYRAVDGTKVPFMIVNSNAMQAVTIKLDKVEHNINLDDALFSVKTSAVVR
jgi:outer membrane lipoprotein-sorting protein